MRYSTLGPSGITVSRLALATSEFGTRVDEATARQLMDVFVESGGTLLDVADVYADGTCEAWVGRWLRDRPALRSSVVVLTKGRSAVRGQPGASLKASYLHQALDASLRRLAVDHVDVYQAHGPDRNGSLEELAQFFADVVAAGKARAVGACNFPGWQLAKLAGLCEQAGTPLSALQVQYSLLAREVEWEVLPAGRDAGVGAVVWGCLGAGLLENTSNTGTQPRHPWEPADSQKVAGIAKVVRDVARRHDLTAEEVAIAWVGHQPGITGTIVGASDRIVLARRMGAAEVHLDDADRQQLDEASRPVTPAYPYEFIEWFAST
jgi:aryl-alcohol dehydrogenase-like predicted oxidoreductase